MQSSVVWTGEQASADNTWSEGSFSESLLAQNHRFGRHALRPDLLEQLVLLFEAQPLWEIIRGEFGVGRDKVGHGLTTNPGHVGVCARERCVSPRGHPDETRCFARTLWILQVDKG